LKRSYWINAAAILSLVALGACQDKAAQAAEAEKSAAAARSSVPASWVLDAGRQFTVVTSDAISSRSAKPGDSFSATVLSDALDSRGRVAIPAGALVRGEVTDVKAARGPSSSGTLTLNVSSVTVRGKSYPIDASIDALDTERQGRGITTGDAAKVGAGAAAGAIIGQVIGKNTKGTVIGAVVGAAAGAGYAAATKDSDIALPEGTHIVLTLKQRVTFIGN
jgi:outer membrane protein with glycine zipper